MSFHFLFDVDILFGRQMLCFIMLTTIRDGNKSCHSFRSLSFLGILSLNLYLPCPTLLLSHRMPATTNQTLLQFLRPRTKTKTKIQALLHFHK